MKLNLNPIKGTCDYLPSDAAEREMVRQKILSVYQKNGYQLITTPALEHIELLSSSDGGDNLRLMFKTLKRGEKLDLSAPNLTENDLVEEGLRYDLTVPLARFYCNNREKLTLPFKSIQIDNAFRAERPQRGRLRQFVQCDIDVFGDKSENAEIDLLVTAVEAYATLGFSDITIHVSDRQALNQIMYWAGFAEKDAKTIAVSVDKIADLGEDGVAKELDEKGFDAAKIKKLLTAISAVQSGGINALSKYGVQSEIVERLQNIISSANTGAMQAISLLKIENAELEQLELKNYKIEFDISIVRGQGYYTGTVFEVYTSSFGRAIGGGGRYDRMVEKLVGQSVPAVGISMGFEPITMLLREMGKTKQSRKLVALFYENEPFEQVLGEKQGLMHNANVSVFQKPKNMKNALDRLKANGFSGYTFVGKSEIIEL